MTARSTVSGATRAGLGVGDGGRDRSSDLTPARSVAAQAWWTIAGITVLVWGYELFGYVDLHPEIILLVVVLGAWGLGTVAASWHPRLLSPRLAETLAWVTLALVLGAFLLWSYLQIVTAPGYGTDEVAFDQYAAQLLTHGSNPYAHSMAPAFSQFHVSPNGYTFGLDGHPITALSYPALSFLLYAPLIALGWSTQTAVVINVIAWAVGIALAFALLPRTVRPLAIAVGSLSVYIGYAVGGVTDALFVPLLIGAVYAWDGFDASRVRTWRGPLLLGLAMAVKQTPWLVLPFLAAGIGIEARRRGSGASGWKAASRYSVIALCAFLVPNLPFMIMSLNKWVGGVTTPILGHATPAGQGVVGLSLFLGIGGGSLTLYSVALGVAFLALLAGFVATYPSGKAWAVMCPAMLLFFSGRSYGSYLVTLLPVAAVGAFTVRRGIAPHPAPISPSTTSSSELPDGAPRWGRPNGASGRPGSSGPDGTHGHWRHWKTVVVGGASAVLAVLIAGVLLRPPLGVRIVSVRTSGQLATVVQLGVEVANNSGTPLRPAFSIETSGAITAFWLRQSGPAQLKPHSRARYLLLAPNFFAQPPVSGGFQVVAFTSGPSSVSRSDAYVPSIWHVSLVPDAINHAVPVNQPVTVHAEVLDKVNRLVHRGGIPVYLGQVIYAQNGLVFGQAIINGGQVGETPVTAYTNSDGVATFTITGTQSSTDPVYFEANLVSSTQYYPYGYSEILPISFGG